MSERVLFGDCRRIKGVIHGEAQADWRSTESKSGGRCYQGTEDSERVVNTIDLFFDRSPNTSRPQTYPSIGGTPPRSGGIVPFS
jgi:hypothetical protein